MILTLGLTSVTIDTKADYPYVFNYEIVQAKEKSGSGITHVENFNVKINTYTFNYKLMTGPDYVKLLDFFVNTAQGMLNKFTLVDDLNVTLLGRFASPILQFELVYFDLFKGSFSVIVEDNTMGFPTMPSE